MKATTNNGIDYILTVYNECDERPVEQMVGKAMCAYANYKTAINEHTKNVNEYGLASVNIVEAECRSEYEATVRCIAMFVEQPTSYICQYVISRCRDELGVC